MNHGTEDRVLHSARVSLRPWTRADMLAQERWPRYSEPFSGLWNIPRIYSYHEDLSQGWSGQRHAWAVEGHSAQLIGRISLREIDLGRSTARLGISLSQLYLSQGLGSEALRLFLAYYFGSLGFASMLLDVAAFNRRAVRCYERLGFSHLGSEWRSAGNDSSLRLLDDARFHDLRPHFRRARFDAQVEFYEMELARDAWLAAGGELI